MSDRGSALLETLAIGFLSLLLVGQVLVTVTRLAGAGELAEETARYVAILAAGGMAADEAMDLAGTLAPGAAITLADAGDAVTVEVVVDVSVVGPASGPVTVEVRGVATAPRSPYRSGP